MSDETSVLRKARCRALGHDWFHRRTEEERECLRCGLKEEYSVDETHGDEEAEKGSKRYRIDGGRLYIERYQVTGWGKDSEEWKWLPIGSGPAKEEHLRQLKEKIKEELEDE